MGNEEIMRKLALDSSMVADVTTVSNLFIDEYMPRANGDFVKIYIHLLRLINGRHTDLDLGSIADIFNFTEGDILRALKYWEGLGLLSFSKNEGNVINGVHLEPFGMDKHYIKGVHAMQPESYEQANNCKLPSRKQYSPKEIEAFATDNQVGQLMFIAQAYLAKPLSSTDINSLLYMYDALSLTTDFIEYIMETCISDGHKSLSYIEKTAVTYYKNDITDIASAKKYKQNKDGLGKKVLDAFGISGRLPGKDESNFLLKWQEEFGYSEDMIIEACNRTLAHTHAPSFKYANSILDSWHKAGVKKIADIEQLDAVHAAESAQKYAAKKAAGVTTPKLKGGQKIQSHSYDFDELEKQLLASSK